MMALRSYGLNPQVKKCYELQRKHHTPSFIKKMKEKYERIYAVNYTLSQIMKLIDKFEDLSDPDLNLPNSHHALQTAYSVRLEDEPDWMIVVGLIHDFGKILAFLNPSKEDGTSLCTQWSLVGDTFISGLPIPKSVPYPDLFHPLESIEYPKKCGLEKVNISWGHDEYLYQVLQRMVNHKTCLLPPEALFIIRYHSLYPWHSYNEYLEIENETDISYKHLVQRFNKYDLYSKIEDPMKWEDYSHCFQPLFNKYFPKRTINF